MVSSINFNNLKSRCSLNNSNLQNHRQEKSQLMSFQYDTVSFSGTEKLVKYLKKINKENYKDVMSDYIRPCIKENPDEVKTIVKNLKKEYDNDPESTYQEIFQKIIDECNTQKSK